MFGDKAQRLEMRGIDPRTSRMLHAWLLFYVTNKSQQKHAASRWL